MKKPTLNPEAPENTGKVFHIARSQIMQADSIGLTNLYNRFHAPADTDPRLVELRDLQCQLDHAVAAAYGWGDLPLDHGFHTVPYLPANDCIRFTISEPARIEVLHRLARLNRQRYEEEVAQGLHEKKAATRKAASKQIQRTEDGSPTEITQQDDLFDKPINTPASIKFKSRKTYCAFLLREVLKQSDANRTHIDQIIAVWAILSEPDAIVNALKARPDANQWRQDYQDQITAEDNLMATLHNMINRYEIKVTRDLVVQLLDDINVPSQITQDVRLALEAISILQEHEPTEAIKRRQDRFKMIEFIKTARQGRYEHAATA